MGHFRESLARLLTISTEQPSDNRVTKTWKEHKITDCNQSGLSKKEHKTINNTLKKTGQDTEDKTEPG